MENKNTAQKKKQKISLIPVFSLPFILTLFIEAIHRQSIMEAFKWCITEPKSLFFSYLLYFLCLNVFYFLPKRLYLIVFYIQSILLGLGAFASYQKFRLRGEYATPFDLYLGKEAENISSSLNGIFTFKFFLMLVVIISMMIGSYRYLKKKNLSISVGKRWIISLVSIILISDMLINQLGWLERNFFNDKIETKTENRLVKKTEKEGMSLSFLFQWENAKLAPPPSYSHKKIESIAKANANEVAKVKHDKKKPNVIVVLSEAFWDPTKMENVSFEKDPIPYFRSLQKTETSGELLVPVFGGGTVNTEFEVLTGMSTSFLPTGSIAYSRYVKQPVDALPQVLKKEGYHTTALHTYFNWFYRRDEVFKQMGFDKFMPLEFFKNPKQVGPFMDDMSIMEQTLKEIKDSKGPDFIQVSTMLNHGPYASSRFPKNTIKVSGDISGDNKELLETYTQSLHEVDKSIKFLIEGLKDIDEPTIVVYYGDHLPLLGDNYSVYKETGYYEEPTTYEGYKKMHSTPFLIWDNFSNKKEKLNISANFIGSYVLDRIGVEKSPIFSMTDQLYEKGVTTVPPKQFFNEEKLNENDMSNYQLLQYDILSGKQYAYQGENKLLSSKNYILGSKEKMKINSSSPKKIETGKPFNVYEGNSFIGLKGENFVFGSKIYINGEEQPTNVLSDKEVNTVVPKKFFKKEGQLKVQVKVIDDKGKEMSASNVVTIDVK